MIRLLGELNLSSQSLFNVGNKITSADGFIHISKANFSNNYFPVVPEELSLLPFLEELDLSKNLIKSAKHMPLLRFLTVLDLSYNELTCIEPSVLQITSLKKLIYSHNKLEIIPNKISQLQQLEYADFQSNKITEISIGLLQLEKLKYVNFKHNLIEKIPDEFEELINLQFVDLSFNKITKITTHFHRISTLVDIFLNNNPIQEPPLSVITLGSKSILNYTFLKECLSSKNKTEDPHPDLGLFTFTDDDIKTQKEIMNLHTKNIYFKLPDISERISSELVNVENNHTFQSVIEQFRILVKNCLGISIPNTIDFCEYISDGIILGRLAKQLDKSGSMNINILSPSNELKQIHKYSNIEMFLCFCRKNIPEYPNNCTSEQVILGKHCIELEFLLRAFVEKYG